MPAYQAAGWTVTAVLPATACPFTSVTVALTVTSCVRESPSTREGTVKRADPAASVRDSPRARSGSASRRRYSEKE